MRERGPLTETHMLRKRRSTAPSGPRVCASWNEPSPSSERRTDTGPSPPSTTRRVSTGTTAAVRTARLIGWSASF